MLLRLVLGKDEKKNMIEMKEYMRHDFNPKLLSNTQWIGRRRRYSVQRKHRFL